MDVAADWQQLHNRFYRKKEVYVEGWKDGLDLNRQIMVGAPYGGAVAVMRNTSKILKDAGDVRKGIQIYNLTGTLLALIPEPSAKVIKLGWTVSEKLIIVQEDGQVQVYNVTGELEGTLSLGKDIGVIADAVVYGDGCVALIARPKIALVSLQGLAGGDLSDAKLRRLADPGLTELPVSWTIIEPQFSASRSVEALLATSTGNVIAVDADKASDQHLAVSPLQKMAVSPTGKLLACFTSTGNLWVVSTDFAKNLVEYPTKLKGVPLQMCWCGTDAVVLYWDKLLLIVGPSSQILNYTYDEPIALLAEIDGVRIMSASKSEMLQRVPQVVEDTFKFGSTAPPAMLVYALEHFDKRSPKADELIRSISKDLPVAVNATIEAAGHEYTISTQRLLLRAASFGKCFIDNYNPTPFVEVCRTLRVLNAVRDASIGLPLTIVEYRQLTADGLINRLLARRKHQLALAICEFIRQKPERVLVHWACSKVKDSPEDNERIYHEIVSKLGAAGGVSFAEIASTAYRSGRHDLATQLLDHEPRAADQIPLLLSMQQEERALNKAIEAGDPDLVYLVVLHLRRSRPADFLSIVRAKPVALALLISYTGQQNSQQLADLYEQVGLPLEIANLQVQQSLQQDDVDTRIKCLQGALYSYKSSKDANAQLAASATEDEIKLLLLQKELEASAGGLFVGQSLYSTLFALIQSNDQRRVAKMKESFRIPDKRFYWIKIKALAQAKKWDELDRFSREKKPPIGYEAFAQVCLKENNNGEAVKYISRITDPKLRAEYFIRLSMWKEAVEAAKEAKDTQLLVTIGNKTPSRDLQAYIDATLQQLR